jgi:hypothetical protein
VSGNAGGGQGLGGVLGDVVRDGLGLQRLASGDDRVPVHGTPVGLGAEAEHDHLAVVLDCEGDGGDGLVDRLAEQVGGKERVRSVVAVVGESGIGARSKRMTAWKWTTPRAWYSATLTYRMRTRARSVVTVMPTRRASWRGR